MNKIHYSLAIDIDNPSTMDRSFTMAQHDNQSYILTITLRRGNFPYYLKEGVQARIFCDKPDGTAVFNDCTIQENNIEAVFTDEMLSAAGRMDCRVSLFDADGTRLTSNDFIVYVRPNKADQSTRASDKFNTLTNALNDIEQSKRTADQALETANQAEEVSVNFEHKVEDALGSIQMEKETAVAALAEIEKKKTAAESAATSANDAKDIVTQKATQVEINKTAVDTAVKNVNAAAKTVAEDKQSALQAASDAEVAKNLAKTYAQNTDKILDQMVEQKTFTKEEVELEYTCAPRRSAVSNGSTIKITDSDRGKAYTELYGNSFQYTAQGTNLWDIKEMIKSMKSFNPSYMAFTYDEYGDGLKFYPYFFKNKRMYPFINDTTKAYKLGCKAKYYSGGSASAVKDFGLYVQFKDESESIESNQISDANTQYADVTLEIPAGKEVDYISFTGTTDSVMFAVLLDSFYLYPVDIPSDELPTSGFGSPTPEYPSEVQSVGEIPKDRNGVEIRNLLNEDLMRTTTLPDPKSNYHYVTEIELSLTPGTYCAKAFPVGNAILPTGFNSNGVTTLLLSKTKLYTSGKYIDLTREIEGERIEPNKINVATGEKLYLLINKNYTLEQIKKNFRIMITKAAIIDEYRPYIDDEYKGLLKISGNAGRNLLNLDVWPETFFDNYCCRNGQSDLKLSGNRWAGAIAKNKSEVELSKGVTKDNLINLKNYDLTQNAIVCIFYEPCSEYNDGSQGNNDRGVVKGIFLDDNLQSVFKKTSPDIYFSMFSAGFVQDGTKRNRAFLKMSTLDQEKVKQIAYLAIGFGISTASAEVRNISVEVQYGDATIVKPYTPYYGEITWVPLKEPLRKIGSDADTITKDGKVIQRIMKLGTTKDGNLDKMTVSAYGSWLYNIVVEKQYNPKDSSLSISNIMKPPTQYEGADSAQGKYGMFWMGKTYLPKINLSKYVSVNNIASMEKFLKDNHFALYYPLITPIIHEIPWIAVQTYDPETQITCLNKIKPSKMTVDYKVSIQSMINRIAALESKAVQEV